MPKKVRRTLWAIALGLVVFALAWILPGRWPRVWAGLKDPQWAVISGAVSALIAGVTSWALARRERRQALEDQAEKGSRVEERRASRERTDREQRCRDLLVYWPLLTVREATPYELGTVTSRLAESHRRKGEPRPPYVKRAQHDELRQKLNTGLLLVTGGSRAGKSRLAFEVAAEVFGDYALVVPRTRHGDGGPSDPALARSVIRELARLNPPPWEERSALIWLMSSSASFAPILKQGWTTRF